ncbi:MAG: hypothetical protein AB7K71_02480 [Polyangiaceae bacterium]
MSQANPTESSAPLASTTPQPPERFQIGVDENGLGARLGPLLVSGVMAEVTCAGLPRLTRRPRGQLAGDLDDSKRLLKHGSIALGEAWARAVVERLAPSPPTTPQDLVRALALESLDQLQAPCPKGLEGHCWASTHEVFTAPEELVDRMRKHLDKLEQDGIRIVGAKSSVICTQRLNAAKSAGVNRFVRNLHAMEELVLAFRESAGQDIHAVCGKVGGIGDYSRFFGPLSGQLHAVLMQKRAHAGYHFPGVGQLHFMMDVDAKHRLVMLASMLGKYLRELLMGRISEFYVAQLGEEVSATSGYNDPVTSGFVVATEALRKQLRVPDTCFERTGADGKRAQGAKSKTKRREARD